MLLGPRGIKVMGGPWGAPTDRDTVCRRAAGRRRHNARRLARAQARRGRLFCMVAGLTRPWPRGLQQELAGVLGVSAATVCRDLAMLRSGAPGALHRTPPGGILA
jgi:hypothetical protein